MPANILIDLSVPMEKNEGEAAPFELKQISHKKGGDIFGRRYAFGKKPTLQKTLQAIMDYITGKKRISSKIFPQEEFLNLDIVTASTHTGTHFDAPLHFGSKSEGREALSVDQIPIEWCFGEGVLLDMTHRRQGEYIQPEDIEEALQKIDYILKPFDIVLIRTGADRYWGTRDYLIKYPGMSKEATGYLVTRGIKIIGVDSYGFDRPFTSMIGDFFKTMDNSCLFPAHFYGREKSYCHIERLTNLDLIPRSFGFKIACFPIKIKNAGAAWTRVVAII